MDKDGWEKDAAGAKIYAAMVNPADHYNHTVVAYGLNTTVGAATTTLRAFHALKPMMQLLLHSLEIAAKLF